MAQVNMSLRIDAELRGLKSNGTKTYVSEVTV